MNADPARLDRRMLWAGVLIAAVPLAAAIRWPGPALSGWLAAAVALAGVAAGALLLVLMMRLIPGVWGEALRLTLEAQGLLVPAAAIAFVPVVVGLASLYPWVGDRGELTGLQRLLLNPVSFVGIGVAWFAALAATADRMRRRRHTARVAAAGLVFLPLLGSLAGVVWLMSLAPEFAASVFGLQFLLRAVLLAFAVALLARLSIGRAPPRLGVLGALLLTLLLLFAYFVFLPFFIAWSGNLPAKVDWYQRRAQDGWPAVAWAFTLLNGVPMFLLLFSPVRSGRRALIAASIAVIAGQLAELAWTALPGRGAGAVLAYAVALAGLALVTAALLRRALRRRITARTPQVRP